MSTSGDKAQTQQYSHEQHKQPITYYPAKSRAPPDSRRSEHSAKALHSVLTAVPDLWVREKKSHFQDASNTHTHTYTHSSQNSKVKTTKHLQGCNLISLCKLSKGVSFSSEGNVYTLGLGDAWRQKNGGNLPALTYTHIAPWALPFSVPRKKLPLTWKHLCRRTGTKEATMDSDFTKKAMAANSNQSKTKHFLCLVLCYCKVSRATTKTT